MALSNDKNAIRVLHVDDNRSFLKFLNRFLLDMDSFEIDNASSVDEAFKKLSSKSFDVVISEYEMPVKNGLKALLAEARNENLQL